MANKREWREYIVNDIFLTHNIYPKNSKTIHGKIPEIELDKMNPNKYLELVTKISMSSNKWTGTRKLRIFSRKFLKFLKKPWNTRCN